MDFDHIDGKKKHNLARYANSAVSIKTIKDARLCVQIATDIVLGKGKITRLKGSPISHVIYLFYE